VHFPVALLLVAALFYIAAIWKKELTLTAFLLHLLGVVACIAAILSGDADEHHAKGIPGAEEMKGLHETLGMVSAWVFGILAIWPFLRRNQARLVERLAFILVFMAACSVLAYGAHLGGRMVYEKGVGVETPAMPPKP
jgi:uncharacterized membrane protein